MASIALAGYALFLLLAFGLRSWIHWRQTGTTGFVGLSGRMGSAEWMGGLLFALAVVAGGAAPALQALGVVAPLAALDVPAAHVVGVVLFAAGLLATLWAQLAMGASWRIGVDASERTELVGGGPFRWVRNPIFSAMTLATIGLALCVPNVVALLALVVLVVGLEVQVRLVEEPHLTRVHGDGYRRYAAATGRFVPGVGRLA